MQRLALVFATALTFAAAAPINAYAQEFGYPCFFGGCRYDPRDACNVVGACAGSWGGVTAADEHSTMAAYRALSRTASAMAAKGAVSPVSIDGDGVAGGSRHARRARPYAPE